MMGANISPHARRSNRHDVEKASAIVARSSVSAALPVARGSGNTNTGIRCGNAASAATSAVIRRGPTVRTMMAAGWSPAHPAKVSRRSESFRTNTFLRPSPPRSTSTATAASVSPEAPRRNARRSGIAAGLRVASFRRRLQHGATSSLADKRRKARPASTTQSWCARSFSATAFSGTKIAPSSTPRSSSAPRPRVVVRSRFTPTRFQRSTATYPAAASRRTHRDTTVADRPAKSASSSWYCAT